MIDSVEKQINQIIDHYLTDDMLQYQKSTLKDRVINSLQTNPAFHDKNKKSVIHSTSWRFKDPEHLRGKLKRKISPTRDITVKNYLEEITDLVGIRVLFLFPGQFDIIHRGILKLINDEGLCLVEEPKAYTWDPEMEKIYDDMEIKHEIKESYYTSVHYVVKVDNSENNVCCEIQVRTLFEEVWGEIDHTINYPAETESIACREQLKVMAKLVSSGTRLCDSIFKSYDEHCKRAKV